MVVEKTVSNVHLCNGTVRLLLGMVAEVVRRIVG